MPQELPRTPRHRCRWSRFHRRQPFLRHLVGWPPQEWTSPLFPRELILGFCEALWRLSEQSPVPTRFAQQSQVVFRDLGGSDMPPANSLPGYSPRSGATPIQAGPTSPCSELAAERQDAAPSSAAAMPDSEPPEVVQQAVVAALPGDVMVSPSRRWMGLPAGPPTMAADSRMAAPDGSPQAGSAWKVPDAPAPGFPLDSHS